MLERPEIYPYQRVEEGLGRAQRRSSEHSWIKELQSKALWKAGFSLDLQGLLTLQNLLVATASVILARAFLLAELLPFIFAFLVAYGYRDREKSMIIAVFSLFGFITVLNGMDLGVNVVTIIVLSAIINYAVIPNQVKWWGVPLLTVVVVLVTKSLMLLLPGGVNFYKEMVVVFEAMIAGVLTFVFMVGGDAIHKKKAMAHFSFEEMASFVVLGTGIIMGLNDIHIAGLGISSILCRLGILLAAFLWGSSGATMVGVMAGIIPSISSSVFAQTLGMYAISGLLAGSFKSFGRLGIIIGFMLGNLAISMFIVDSQATIMGMWETIIASLIFFLLPESLKEKVPFESLGTLSSTKDTESQILDSHMKEEARNQIHHLAHVFDEISSSFVESTSVKQKNRGATLNYLYDELSHGFCEGCARHNHCWNKEGYSTSQEILDIFTIAENQGQVNYDECPAAFRRKCIHGRELISTINYLFDNLRMNEYWSGMIDESRQLVSRQLKGVSTLVKDLAEEFSSESFVDLELRDRLLKSCKRMGINLKEITPVRSSAEQLYFNVVAHSCVDGTGCELSIAPTISSILGEKVEVSNKRCPRFMGKGACEFTLTRAFNYRINSAAAQVAKEETCGDSLSITTLKEGKELVVLSDGMGIGEKAASESRTAVNLLENLLNGGFNKEMALRTINSVLLLRSSKETFTTLDMVLVDLYTGDVDFIKTASAPSFIKRGKQVAVIRSSSLPIGILDNIEIVSDRRLLYPRDMLVMVSDGVMDVNREINGEEWIQKTLADMHETDPRVVAELIINQALSLCKGKPRDDMTVICLVLELN